MTGSAFSYPSLNLFSSLTRSNVVPLGDKNGVNATFTLPNDEAYMPVTLSVFLNGQMIHPSAVTKNGPDYKTFTVDSDNIPVDNTDVLTCSFSVKSL